MISSVCSALSTPPPVPTDTPELTATATVTLTPTKTPKASPTPKPTSTPNLAATEQMDLMQAEAQKYFDLGYIETSEGRFREFEDFEYERAQLGWYQRFY